ncbi:unnamed protein product [Amoebophrya sp. A120]|nr:unnamed protein product [Amoebophrya sp. A120]|eukprot:GSA120T00025693001.1
MAGQTEQVTRLLQVKEKLVQICNASEDEAEIAAQLPDLLDELEKVHVTHSLLKETLLGKAVREVSVSPKVPKDLADKASQLVLKWKRVVQLANNTSSTGSQLGSQASLAKMNPGAAPTSNRERSPRRAEPTTGAASSSSSAEQGTSSQHPEDKERKEEQPNSQQAQQQQGQHPRANSQAPAGQDGIKNPSLVPARGSASFPSVLGGSTDAGDKAKLLKSVATMGSQLSSQMSFTSGDPRVVTRTKLHAALVYDESENEYGMLEEEIAKKKLKNCDDIAAEMEQSLFNELKGKEYSIQVRSILSNLKDKRNKDFKLRVRLGMINLADSYKLTPHDMASDDKRKEREKIIQEATEAMDLDYDKKRMKISSTFTCNKCNTNRCTYYQLQTRSSDEPMTTFVSESKELLLYSPRKRIFSILKELKMNCYGRSVYNMWTR